MNRHTAFNISNKYTSLRVILALLLYGIFGLPNLLVPAPIYITRTRFNQ